MGKPIVLLEMQTQESCWIGSKMIFSGKWKNVWILGKNVLDFFMAVGNHIPANTPVENALYYNEVFEQLRSR